MSAVMKEGQKSQHIDFWKRIRTCERAKIKIISNIDLAIRYDHSWGSAESFVAQAAS